MPHSISCSTVFAGGDGPISTTNVIIITSPKDADEQVKCPWAKECQSRKCRM